MIRFDAARGFLTCSISSVISDAEVTLLCADLDRGLTDARTRGTLRLLWDHRGQSVIVDGRAEKLLAVWKRHCREGDRIAILVSNSLDKVQGKPVTAEEAAFFMSENAAHTWLGIGAAQAA
ncbi:MAG TPA: hypothetical protein VF475_02270 [Sphingobium sp.]